MDLMSALARAWLIAAFTLLLQQPTGLDPLWVQYHDALALAPQEGLQPFVRRLDQAVALHPGSAFVPQVHETIQSIALLHPGSVPDQAARLQLMKEKAAGGANYGASLTRIEMLSAYYADAALGRPETHLASLTDPVFEGSAPALLARADAALRAADLQVAEALAQEAIELDPYSPLLASAYVIRGLGSGFRGLAAESARRFQQAIAVSPLPTRHGNTLDLLATAFRFAQPFKAPLGGVFSEVAFTALGAAQNLRDPAALLVHEGNFVLVDRDQLLTLNAAGEVLERKPARNLEDCAPAGPRGLYLLTDEALDPASGRPMPLAVQTGGRTRNLGKMRSLAVDDRNDVYLLDQDAGLLRGSLAPGAPPSLVPLKPLKGRLIRLDRRGYLYVLDWDRHSIMVLSRDGAHLASITPGNPGGKRAKIEYFSIDNLNHVYILDNETDTIHIVAVNDRSGGIETVPVGSIALDSRPQFKNLRVIAIAPTGEMVATGKNENTWVIFR